MLDNPQTRIEHEMPPLGGIFLSQELETPPYIEELILARHQHQRQNFEARQKLDQLFPLKENPNNPFEKDLFSEYQKSMIDVIERVGSLTPPSASDLANIAYVEGLKEKAGLYDDTSSTIWAHGEKLVEALRHNLALETYVVGQNTYQVDYQDKRGQNRFIGLDKDTGECILFNYYERLIFPLTRYAQLKDYEQLVFDINMERIRLGSESAQPEVSPVIADTDSVKLSQERFLANMMHAYSYCFWLTHKDLMLKDSARVIQASDIAAGDIQDQADKELGSCRALDFIVSSTEPGEYVWQLSTFYPTINTRKVAVLEITPRVTKAIVYRFNAQGQYIGEKPAKSEALFNLIFELLEDPVSKSLIHQRREKICKMREAINAFAVKAVVQPTDCPHTQDKRNACTNMLDEQALKLRSATFNPAERVRLDYAKLPHPQAK